MKPLNIEYELYRAGLTRTIKFKSHTRELIEFTVKSDLVDDMGREIVKSGHTCFFDTKEFVEFFGPIINELYLKLNNDITNRT